MKSRSYIVRLTVKFLFFLSFVVVVLILSCQEYYTDSNIINGEEILVIEGLITNEPGPYKIKITNSLPYNHTSEELTNSSAVSNANVSIVDNTGITEQLTENEAGVYYTSAGMRGEIGKMYTLQILTSDGYSYQSDSCSMEMPATIDSLYAELAEVTVLEKIESGQYIEKTYDGINLFMDAQPSPGKEYYYKVESKTIKQTFHNEWRNGRPVPGIFPPPRATGVYCWYTSLLNIEKDLMSNATTEFQTIKKRMVGFITSYVISEPDVINDPTYFFGAINTTTLYSLSKRIYEIYIQLNSQTKPENSIFDPIPTRIESNIICINDPSRTVLGYFGAAAVVRKTYFFNWNKFGITKKVIVDSIPVLPFSKGCRDTEPPSFWIEP